MPYFVSKYEMTRVFLLPCAVIQCKSRKYPQTLLQQVGRFRAQAQRTRDHIAGFLQCDNILFGFEQQLERTRIILGFDEILIQMRTALDLIRNVDGRSDKMRVLAVRRTDKIIVIARQRFARHLIAVQRCDKCFRNVGHQ